MPQDTSQSQEYDPVPLEDYMNNDLERSAHGPKVRARPILLHPLVGWGLVVLCVALSITLAVIYWYSEKNNGLFTISPASGVRESVLRFLWSSGPTLVMTIITGGILGPLALALYLVAPYAALERGEAKAENSIMANYAILGVFSRFQLAKRNRKWGLVTLAIATFLGSLLDTAASGLIESQNVIITSNVPIQIAAPLGIADSTDGNEDEDHNHIFLSSDEYLAAALFAGGQQLFQPSPVPFSYYGQEGNWSVTPLTPMKNLQELGHGYNASIAANVTVVTHGINTNANCKMASIAFGENEMVIATVDGCSFDFSLVNQTTYRLWHFANSTRCNNASRSDIAFKAFVYAVYSPSGYEVSDPNQFVVMFCQPSISIAKVSATLSVSHQGVIGAVVAPPVVLESFPIGGNASDPNVANLLGPPLNGMAINGYDIAEPANTTLLSRSARVNITRSILFEGVYGAQLNHVGDVTNWFNATQRLELGGIVSEFYQAYLNTLSPRVYFNPKTNITTMITGSLTAPSARAVVSRMHAIALGTLLILLASLLTITLVKQPMPYPGGHALKLYSSTISSHVMASTGHLHQVITPLSGLKEKHIKDKLRDRRFSINHQGKIVVQKDCHRTSTAQPETRRSSVTHREDIIAQLDSIFDRHPSFRPAHSHGIMLTGVFTPTAEAATLSDALHFTQPSTPITVHFSSSTGIPLVPNNDPNTNPRGFAVRFHLGKVHTDIIGHSTPSFPAGTAAEFLEFVLSLASSAPGGAPPTPIETFLTALAFVQTLKPPPTSFAREDYFDPKAMKFISSEGTVRFGRYSIMPDAGIEHLDETTIETKTPNFLVDELRQRITHGTITFHLHVQLANDGETVNDVTVQWPEDRTIINLGKFTLNALVADNDRKQKELIFDPIPRVQGIEPSDDPWLELLAAIYLMSGRRRRAAPGTSSN